MIACRLGRIEYVKILLEAGADQTIRDYSWNNLLHSALRFNPKVAKLKSLLELLDSGLVTSMITERNNLGEDGRTPLHAWISKFASQRGQGRYENDDDMIEVLKFLLDAFPEAGKRALWMVDGTGDTPLHTLVAGDRFETKVVEAILSLDPDLLFRENAVGRTPFEVAHDQFFADKCNAPGEYSWYRTDDSTPRLVASQVDNFVKKSAEPVGELEDRSRAAVIWKLCSEYEKKAATKKRRLVSLHEANDVARRLGEKHMGDRYKFKVTQARSATTVSDGDNNAGGEEKRPVLAEKRSRGSSDFVTERYFSFNDAWDTSKEKKPSEDEDVPTVCHGCGTRHG